MKRKNPVLSPITNSGTYSDKIHHGEVKIAAQFLHEKAAPQQNLATDKGVRGAVRILRCSLTKGK